MAALDEQARVARLLQRTGFGGSGEAAAGAGWQQTLDRVLAQDDDAEAPAPPPLGPLPERGKGGAKKATRRAW